MFVFGVVFLTFCLVFGSPMPTQDDFELVIKGIEEFLKTHIEPEYLAEALKNYQLTHLFSDEMENVYDNNQLCYMCNLAADLIIIERRAGLSRDTFAKEAQLLCTHLGIANHRVCAGIVELNIDVLLYIIDNHRNVTSNRICGSVFQNLGCPKGDAFEWSIDLPSGNSPDRDKSVDSEIFRVVQLSDIHYDPNYTPNGNADCGEPMCCQEDQGEAASPETACGYWTDYRNADVPWHLVEETIRQVKTQEFDYVYYTGDIINHRVWETSISNNTNTISRLNSYFKESFNVPVYPVFGNHEPHPMELWPTESVKDEKFSIQWLFELAADSWSDLVGEDIRETVLKGGYYTVSPRPGFRIIAINSNMCYRYNWWLIFEDKDPYGQLQWLADTLKEAEDNDESVHILSHVPTGLSSSLSVWGREYSRIVARFANTITGQFNGHTHKDQFHVYYNKSNPTQPVGVAFNGASVTPNSNSNPSYKIYEVDSKTFSLRDFEEWTFNLTLANSQPSTQSPDWYKLYSFIEAYGVENLNPVEVDKILYKMAENHTLLDDYFKFKCRNGDPGISAGCTDGCKKSNLCEIATTVYGEDTHCNRFLNLYDQRK